MIETEDFKIAENEDVAFWKKLEADILKSIKSHEREIIINREILALAITKQKELEE